MGACLCKISRWTKRSSDKDPVHEEEAIVKEVLVETTDAPTNFDSPEPLKAPEGETRKPAISANYSVRRSLSLSAHLGSKLGEEAETLSPRWPALHYQNCTAAGELISRRHSRSYGGEGERSSAARERSMKEVWELRRDIEEAPASKREVRRVGSSNGSAVPRAFPRRTTSQRRSMTPKPGYRESLENPLVSLECFIFL